jgi:hypothetical protein
MSFTQIVVEWIFNGFFKSSTLIMGEMAPTNWRTKVLPRMQYYQLTKLATTSRFFSPFSIVMRFVSVWTCLLLKKVVSWERYTNLICQSTLSIFWIRSFSPTLGVYRNNRPFLERPATWSKKRTVSDFHNSTVNDATLKFKIGSRFKAVYFLHLIKFIVCIFRNIQTLPE